MTVRRLPDGGGVLFDTGEEFLASLDEHEHSGTQGYCEICGQFLTS